MARMAVSMLTTELRWSRNVSARSHRRASSQMSSIFDRNSAVLLSIASATAAGDGGSGIASTSASPVCGICVAIVATLLSRASGDEPSVRASETMRDCVGARACVYVDIRGSLRLGDLIRGLGDPSSPCLHGPSFTLEPSDARTRSCALGLGWRTGRTLSGIEWVEHRMFRQRDLVGAKVLVERDLQVEFLQVLVTTRMNVSLMIRESCPRLVSDTYFDSPAASASSTSSYLRWPRSHDETSPMIFSKDDAVA